MDIRQDSTLMDVRRFDKDYQPLTALKYKVVRDGLGGFVGSNKWKAFRKDMGSKLTVRYKLPIRSSYIRDLESCPRYYLLRDRMGLKLRAFEKLL